MQTGCSHLPARQEDSETLTAATGTAQVKREEEEEGGHDQDFWRRGGDSSNKRPRVEVAPQPRRRPHDDADDVQAQLARLTKQHEEELEDANKRLRKAMGKYEAEKGQRHKAQKLLAKVGREMGLFEDGTRLSTSEAVERLFKGLTEARERVQELEKGAATHIELVNAARGRERGGGGGGGGDGASNGNLWGGGIMSQELYVGFLEYLVQTRNLGLTTAAWYCCGAVKVLTAEIPPQSLPGAGLQDKVDAQAFLARRGAAITERLTSLEKDLKARTSWKHFRGYVEGGDSVARRAPRSQRKEGMSAELLRDLITWLEQAVKKHTAKLYGQAVSKVIGVTLASTNGSVELLKDEAEAQNFVKESGAAVMERVRGMLPYYRAAWGYFVDYLNGTNPSRVFRVSRLPAGEGILSKELREDFVTWLEMRKIKMARTYGSIVDKVLLSVTQGAGGNVEDKASALCFMQTWRAAIVEQLEERRGDGKSQSAWRHFIAFLNRSEPSPHPMSQGNASSNQERAGTKAKPDDTGKDSSSEGEDNDSSSRSSSSSSSSSSGSDREVDSESSEDEG